MTASNIIVKSTAGERVFVRIAPSFTEAQTSNIAKINDEGTRESCSKVSITIPDVTPEESKRLMP